MAEVTPQGFASEIIDLCAASSIVRDYDLQIRDNVVLRCRVHLVEGFVDVERSYGCGSGLPGANGTPGTKDINAHTNTTVSDDASGAP